MKKNRFLLFMFVLITLFVINASNVYAEEKTVVRGDAASDFDIFLEDQTVEKITLESDIDLSCYGVDKVISGSKYGFYNYKYFAALNLGSTERTLDLNGHTINFNQSAILINRPVRYDFCLN